MPNVLNYLTGFINYAIHEPYYAFAAYVIILLLVAAIGLFLYIEWWAIRVSFEPEGSSARLVARVFAITIPVGVVVLLLITHNILLVIHDITRFYGNA